MEAQQGFTIWFTGLSGSGKSTLANLLVERLQGMGRNVELLDGDEVRKNLSSGLGFSKADRDANIRRIAFVAKLLSRNGVIAITAAISPYRAIRDEARQEIGNFVEVFVDCPLEICEERDVKGLYKKARAGEIQQFTGISDPYEAPENPEVVVHTDKESPEESVSRIIDRLGELGYLPREAVGAGAGAYTADEEALVSERLKNLGYL
jgi:adenylyl-sulfate kinase